MRRGAVEVFDPLTAELGESPCWLPRRGRLAWVDIEAKLLHLSGGGGRRTTIELPEEPGAVVEAEDGRLLLAMGTGFHRVDLESRRIEPVCHVPGADPELVRMNDGKVDSRGRFWAGTKAHDEKSRIATLYRLDGDDCSPPLLDGLTISNGLAWSLDDSALFHIDTPSRTVMKHPFDSATGEIGRGSVLADTRGLSGWPDGMAIDTDGDLWVAFWDGWAVRCLSGVTGSLLGEIALPVARPTSCCFGGTGYRTLFVTSARTGIEEAALAAQPHAGSVFALEPGVVGCAATLARARSRALQRPATGRSGPPRGKPPG